MVYILCVKNEEQYDHIHHKHVFFPFKLAQLYVYQVPYNRFLLYDLNNKNKVLIPLKTQIHLGKCILSEIMLIWHLQF